MTVRARTRQPIEPGEVQVRQPAEPMARPSTEPPQVGSLPAFGSAASAPQEPRPRMGAVERAQVWASIAQVGATLIAAIALILAFQPIQETKRSLRANTLYNIQKDGRELFASLIPDGVYQYIYAYDRDKNYKLEVEEMGQLKVRQLVNFYASVYN